MVRVVPGSSRRRSSSNNKSGGVNNNNAASDTAESNNNNKTTTTGGANHDKGHHHHHHHHGRHSYRNLYHNDYHHSSSSPSSTLAGRFMVLLLGMAIGIYLVKHHEKQMDDTYYTLLNTVIPDNQASPIDDDDFRNGHYARVVVLQTSNYSGSNGPPLPAKKKTMTKTMSSTSTAAKITSSKGRSSLSSKSSSTRNTATTNRTGKTGTKTTATNSTGSATTVVKKAAPAAQVPYYPRPRTDGKVWFWNHRAVSDWHHVRQGGLAVSWIIAYYTGHAIQQQHPMPSQQFLWNQTLLTQFVHWENLKVPDGTTLKQIAKERRKGITKITPDVKYSSRKNVEDELKDRTNIGVYSGSTGWSFVRYTFPWLDPFEKTSDPATTTTFKRMMAAFTYNDKIQELADKVIAEMWGVSAYGDQTDNFMGLEVLTDHRPAVDCKAYGSKVYPKTTATSTASTTKISGNSTTSEDPSLLLSGSCVDVDWKDIIKGRAGQQKMPIYVSHNLRQDQTFDAARVLGKAAVAGSRGDSANIYQRSDFDFLASRRLGIISAVEQVVMTRAKYFVASVHSPWSDYVILKRIYGDGSNGNNGGGKLDGEANYKIWKDKLSYRVEPKSLSPVAPDSDADSSSTSVLASDASTTKAQASTKAAAPRKTKVQSSRKTKKATKVGGGKKNKSSNKVKQEATTTTAAAWAKKLKEDRSS